MIKVVKDKKLKLSAKKEKTEQIRTQFLESDLLLTSSTELKKISIQSSKLVIWKQLRGKLQEISLQKRVHKPLKLMMKYFKKTAIFRHNTIAIGIQAYITEPTSGSLKYSSIT